MGKFCIGKNVQGRKQKTPPFFHTRRNIVSHTVLPSLCFFPMQNFSATLIIIKTQCVIRLMHKFVASYINFKIRVLFLYNFVSFKSSLHSGYFITKLIIRCFDKNVNTQTIFLCIFFLKIDKFYIAHQKIKTHINF